MNEAIGPQTLQKMKPKKQKREPQIELLETRLERLCDHSHPLYVLANQIDWSVFDAEYGELYSDKGRPGLPTRVMVGLHYLKHTFNESDETVVWRFVENPYWQYFCGYEYFQHKAPIDPSSMTRWRNRIGSDRLKLMLSQTLETAKRRGDVGRCEFSRVNVDTTVQEKAVAHPTDARLYQKARLRLVKEARKRGIPLRQSYARRGKAALVKQGRYAHAKQFRRARRKTKELRNYLGRVLRDIERNCPEPDHELAYWLEVCGWVYEQQRTDKNKVYAIHALEVECISKGKARKRYEFGCKVSVVASSKNNWVLAADAIHSNPFDGHTLNESLESAEATCGRTIEQVFVDKGYRGAARDVPDKQVYMSGAKRLPRALKRWLRRRQAVEPVIGHMKGDHRMDRNHLHGWEGDRINALLAGCGFNLSKLYRAAALFVRDLILQWLAEFGERAPIASLAA
jgi:IS5 family transposase